MFFAAAQERSLLEFAESLARNGYSPDEIREAIEACLPAFREGAELVLRQVTIGMMMVEAGNG